MNAKNIIEQITKIAPKYRPDSDDLSWFENELEKVAAKALPKLIKKRFTLSLTESREPKAVSRVSNTAPVSTRPAAHASDVKS